MARETIDKVRAEIQRIKAFQKKLGQKLTPESLGKFPGFENMSLEIRQRFLDTMRALCQITLLHINKTGNNGQNRKEQRQDRQEE